MTDPDSPLLEDAKRQIASLTADVRRMLDLRWRLARLEITEAVGSVKRLAVVLALVVVAVLVALPVLVVYAAELLGRHSNLSFSGWLLIFGVGLLTVSLAGGWLAWLRFRREFTGLEETLEELREDLVWLDEWRGEERREERREKRE